jgi:hypothetical protein
MSPEERAAAKTAATSGIESNVLRQLEKSRLAAAEKEAAKKSPAEGTSAIEAAVLDQLKTSAAGAEGVSGPVPWYTKLSNAAQRAVVSVTGDRLPAGEEVDPKVSQGLDLAKFGPLGLLVGAPVAAMGAIDSLANRDRNEGGIKTGTTLATALMDTLSLGSMNRVEAAADTMLGNPLSDGSINADYWSQLNEEALQQDEIRRANPKTAFGGDVLGFALPGAALGKVAFSAAAEAGGAVGKLVATPVNRVLFGSGIGAAQSGAYTLTKTGDLQEALVDSSLAMLGGVVLGGLALGGTAGAKAIFGSKMKPDAINAATGKELLDKANEFRAAQGLPPASAAQVMEDLQKMGPDAALLDIFPGLQGQANRIISKGGDAAETLRGLMATRNEFFRELTAPDGTLRTAFAAEALPSKTAIAREAKDRMANLSPQYTEVFKANAGVTISAKQILDNVTMLFGPTEKWAGPELDAFKLLSKEIKQYLKQTPKGQKRDALPLEQATKLLQFLSGAAGKQQAKVAGKDALVRMTSATGRRVTQAADYVRSLLDTTVEDLKPLNALYKDYASMQTAYKAGKTAFASDAQDMTDILAFIGDTTKGTLTKRAYVEGAKYHLFTLLDKAPTAAAIDDILTKNRPLIAKMEGMFGKDPTAEMVGATKAMVTKAKTAEQLTVAQLTAPARELIESQGGKGLKDFVDLAIATAAPFGITSKAGGAGALGRLVGRPVSDAVETQADTFAGDMLSKVGEGASSAFVELQKMLQRSAAASTAPEVSRTVGAAGVVPAIQNLQGQ